MLPLSAPANVNQPRYGATKSAAVRIHFASVGGVRAERSVVQGQISQREARQMLTEKQRRPGGVERQLRTPKPKRHAARWSCGRFCYAPRRQRTERIQHRPNEPKGAVWRRERRLREQLVPGLVPAPCRNKSAEGCCPDTGQRKHRQSAPRPQKALRGWLRCRGGAGASFGFVDGLGLLRSLVHAALTARLRPTYVSERWRARAARSSNRPTTCPWR